MRKTTTFQTYKKVRDFFISNPKEGYNKTFLRDNLKIDFYSLCLVLNELVHEQSIYLEGREYKLKR